MFRLDVFPVIKGEFLTYTSRQEVYLTSQNWLRFFAFTDVIFNPNGILNIGISLLLNPVASFTSVTNFQECLQPCRGPVKTTLSAHVLAQN